MLHDHSIVALNRFLRSIHSCISYGLRLVYEDIVLQTVFLVAEVRLMPGALFVLKRHSVSHVVLKGCLGLREAFQLIAIAVN